MINISELARSDMSLLGRIHSLTEFDIYYAEDVADIQRNRPQLRYPLCRDLLISTLGGCYVKETYVLIHNVGIERLRDGESKEVKDFFKLHDGSGTELVYWGRGLPPYFDAEVSFEEAQETQGFEDGDWVFEVFLNYIDHMRLYFPLAIVSVQKNESSENRSHEEPTLPEKIRSLVGRIREYIPNYPPAPLPVPTDK